MAHNLQPARTILLLLPRLPLSPPRLFNSFASKTISSASCQPHRHRYYYLPSAYHNETGRPTEPTSPANPTDHPPPKLTKNAHSPRIKNGGCLPVGGGDGEFLAPDARISLTFIGVCVCWLSSCRPVGAAWCRRRKDCPPVWGRGGG